MPKKELQVPSRAQKSVFKSFIENPTENDRSSSSKGNELSKSQVVDSKYILSPILSSFENQAKIKAIIEEKSHEDDDQAFMF